MLWIYVVTCINLTRPFTTPTTSHTVLSRAGISYIQVIFMHMYTVEKLSLFCISDTKLLKVYSFAKINIFDALVQESTNYTEIRNHILLLIC